MVSSMSSMIGSTSSGGRAQFSVENAYTASESMPRSTAASTVLRAPAPLRDVLSRPGRPRDAQRRSRP